MSVSSVGGSPQKAIEPDPKHGVRLVGLYTLLCLAYVLWGIIPLWLSRTSAMNPLTIAAIRFLVSPIFLLLPSAIISLTPNKTGKSTFRYLMESMSGQQQNPRFRVPRIVLLIVNSMIFAAAIDLYIMGLMNLPMWAAAALSYTYPLFDIAGRSIIEAATRRRTKQNRFAVWILASLAVAGASLISIKDFNGPAPVFYSVLYPLGFAALWALFANMSSLDTSKQLSQSPLSERIRFSLTKVGIMLGLSGVINVIVLALCQQSQLIVLADFFRCTISGHSESMSQGVVLSIIGLISISTAIPYALFSWTMQEESTVKGKRRKINPTMALVLQSIETLTAVAVAMIIAHESPLPHQILGLTFIIAADTALIKKL